MAEELIENHGACFVQGGPAVWRAGRYWCGWEDVSRAILDVVPGCTSHDRKEVHGFLSLAAPRLSAAHPTLVTARNGAFDMEGMAFGALTRDMIIPNIIPHDWVPDAYDEGVDRFLADVSCGDAAMRANLEEVAGLCIYRSNEFGVCPMLMGTGANGKSTYLELLGFLLGEENVSHMDMAVIGRQFQAALVAGKLANLGDNISNERLGGDVLSVTKKLITGEPIHTDVKNGIGFDFTPYCTPVFSCNEFPRLGDSSDSMMRRFFPIPFSARFAPGVPGFDPGLRRKLRTERAASYMLRLAIEGLARVMAQQGMTPNSQSETILAEVREENDSVLRWPTDSETTAASLHLRPVKAVYDEYCAWCIEMRLHPFGQPTFTKRVNAALGTRTDGRRLNYSTGPKKVRVFLAPGA